MRRDVKEVAKFNALYEKILQEGETYTEAYHKAEKIVRKQEGRPFYKNFESFSAARRFYMRHHRRNRN